MCVYNAVHVARFTGGYLDKCSLSHSQLYALYSVHHQTIYISDSQLYALYSVHHQTIYISDSQLYAL